MSTRTPKGNLRINDHVDSDRTLTITPAADSLLFLAVDAAVDERVQVHLGPDELDELEAEIRRLRTERGI